MTRHDMTHDKTRHDHADSVDLDGSGGKSKMLTAGLVHGLQGGRTRVAADGRQASVSRQSCSRSVSILAQLGRDHLAGMRGGVLFILQAQALSLLPVLHASLRVRCFVCRHIHAPSVGCSWQCMASVQAVLAPVETILECWIRITPVLNLQ